MTRMVNKQKKQSFSTQGIERNHTHQKTEGHPKKNYQSIADSEFSTVNYFGTGSIKNSW